MSLISPAIFDTFYSTARVAHSVALAAPLFSTIVSICEIALKTIITHPEEPLTYEFKYSAHRYLVEKTYEEMACTLVWGIGHFILRIALLPYRETKGKELYNSYREDNTKIDDLKKAAITYRNPDAIQAYITHLGANGDENAIEYLKQLPSPVKPRGVLANAHLKRGETDQAIENLKRLLLTLQGAEKADIHFQLYELDRTRVQDLKAAAFLDHQKALQEYISILRGQKDTETLLPLLEKLPSEQRLKEECILLGHYYLAQNKLEQAKKYYDEADKIGSDVSTQYFVVLAQLLGKCTPEEQTGFYWANKASVPEAGWATTLPPATSREGVRDDLALAAAKRLSSDSNGFSSLTEKLLRLSIERALPPFARQEALLLLTSLLRQERRLQDAIICCQEYLKNDPKDLTVSDLLCELYMESGNRKDNDDAATLVETVFYNKRMPLRPATLFALGMLELKKLSPDAGQAHIVKAAADGYKHAIDFCTEKGWQTNANSSKSTPSTQNNRSRSASATSAGTASSSASGTTPGNNNLQRSNSASSSGKGGFFW